MMSVWEVGLDGCSVVQVYRQMQLSSISGEPVEPWLALQGDRLLRELFQVWQEARACSEPEVQEVF
jgi:hypothetical protein